MCAARPESILPGPVRQNGCVVRNLERAMEAWLALGVGPWLVLPHITQTGSVYRGRPTEPVVSIAFANSGALQMELIEQEDDSPSIYAEFLDAGREGLHHLAWWADDFDEVAGAARRAAWPVVHEGDAGGMARFAYFDLEPSAHTVVEVMELTDASRWLVERVREAAAGWDGANPVRALA